MKSCDCLAGIDRYTAQGRPIPISFGIYMYAMLGTARRFEEPKKRTILIDSSESCGPKPF